MAAAEMMRIDAVAARVREHLVTVNPPDDDLPRPLQALDVHDLARVPFKMRETILEPWLHSL